MQDSVEQAVLLTEAGANALQHLSPWLNGRFLRCRDVDVHTQGVFLTVIAIPRALPFEEALGDAALWIPMHHVDLVVRDSKAAKIGSFEGFSWITKSTSSAKFKPRFLAVSRTRFGKLAVPRFAP